MQQLHTGLNEIVRFLNIARNLHRGSRGRECSGQGHQNDVLVRDTFLQADFLRREAEMEFRLGDFGTHTHCARNMVVRVRFDVTKGLYR